MDGLKEHKYLHTTRKRFDPIGLGISIAGLLGVIIAAGGVENSSSLWDFRSCVIVVGGTFASLLFQFDVSTCFHAAFLVGKSFIGTPESRLLKTSRELDHAILNDRPLMDLRDGSEINGELLNDIVHMAKKGLIFDEIDAFVTARVKDEFFARQQAASLLDRAALIAPAVGLFGTVIGLIEVLQNLANPNQIGASMALALITTAYGAGLASIVFTPLSGRLVHHNAVFLEIHRQILSKISVMLRREDRMISTEENETKVVGM